MPIPRALLDKINDYESQGYTPDEIMEGLSTSQTYPDIAKRVTDYRNQGYEHSEIYQGLKTSPIQEGMEYSQFQETMLNAPVATANIPQTEKMVTPSPVKEETATWPEVAKGTIKSIPGHMLRAAGGLKRGYEESEMGQKMAELSTELTKGMPEEKPMLPTGKAIAEKGTEIIGKAMPTKPVTRTQAYVSGAAQNILQNLSWLIPAVITKNPAVALGGMGVTAAGEAYQTQREKGMKPSIASLAATGYGASEILTEFIPVGMYLKPGMPFIKRILSATMAEVPTEMLNEIAQEVIDKVTIDPNMTLEQAASRVFDTAVVTLMSSPFIAGGTHQVGKMLNGNVKQMYDARTSQYQQKGMPEEQAKAQAIKDVANTQAGKMQLAEIATTAKEETEKAYAEYQEAAKETEAKPTEEAVEKQPRVEEQPVAEIEAKSTEEIREVIQPKPEIESIEQTEINDIKAEEAKDILLSGKSIKEHIREREGITVEEIEKKVNTLIDDAITKGEILYADAKKAKVQLNKDVTDILSEKMGVEEKPTEAPKAEKQPWQMTREEYLSQDNILIEKVEKETKLIKDKIDTYSNAKISELFNKLRNKPTFIKPEEYKYFYDTNYLRNNKPIQGATPYESEIEAKRATIKDSFVHPESDKIKARYEEGHKAIIQRSLSEGKPVPEEVLRDYPELVKTKPTEAPKAEKQPWQMTRKEYTSIPNVGMSFQTWDKGKIRDWGVIKKIEGDNVKLYLSSQPEGYKTRTESLHDIKQWLSEGLIKAKEKKKTIISEGKIFEAQTTTEHERLVQQALSEGKPVPEEVLKDYPELAEKQGKIEESAIIPEVKPKEGAGKEPIGKIPEVPEGGIWTNKKAWEFFYSFFKNKAEKNVREKYPELWDKEVILDYEVGDERAIARMNAIDKEMDSLLRPYRLEKLKKELTKNKIDDNLANDILALIEKKPGSNFIQSKIGDNIYQISTFNLGFIKKLENNAPYIYEKIDNGWLTYDNEILLSPISFSDYGDVRSYNAISIFDILNEPIRTPKEGVQPTPELAEKQGKIEKFYQEGKAREKKVEQAGFIKVPEVKESSFVKNLANKIKDKIKSEIEPFTFYKKAPPELRNDIRTEVVGGVRKLYDLREKHRVALFGGMEDNAISKAVEIIYARDEVARQKRGKGNPQFTLEEIQNKLSELEKSASQEELEAANRWREISKTYQRELINRGILNKEDTFEDYARHYVIDYTPEWSPYIGIPAKLRRPFRGYTKRAFGTTKAYRQDADSLIDYLTEVDSNNMLEDFIISQAEKFDITPTLNKEQKAKLFGKDKAGRTNPYAKISRIYDIEGKRYRAYSPDKPFTRRFYPTETGEIAIGRQKKAYLVPENVYSVFESFSPRGSKGWYIINKFTSYFKSSAILSVFPRYNINNFIGDSWMVALQHPNPIKFTKNIDDAITYLIKDKAKFSESDKAFEKWLKNNDILGSTFIGELPHIRATKNPLKYLLRRSQEVSQFREAILRGANAHYLFEEMQKGNANQIRDYFNYINTEGLTDERAMGKIAREILIDYESTSKTYNKAIRGFLFPFGRWYFKGSELVWKYAKAHPFRALGGLIALPVLGMLLNNRNDEIKELEMQLPEELRDQFHIVLGETGDGRIRVWTMQTPQDALIGTKIFSIAFNQLNMYKNKEKTLIKAAEDTIKNWGIKEAKGIVYLTTPVIRFLRGLADRRDPMDNLPLYPLDVAKLTPKRKIWYDTLFFGKCMAPMLSGYIREVEGKIKPADQAAKEVLNKFIGLPALGIRDYSAKTEIILPDGSKLNYDDYERLKKTEQQEAGILLDIKEDFIKSGLTPTKYMGSKQSEKYVKQILELHGKTTTKEALASLGERIKNELMVDSTTLKVWYENKIDSAKTDEEKLRLREQQKIVKSWEMIERLKRFPKSVKPHILEED